MNYIKRLQAENAELQAKLAQVQADFDLFLAHLHSPKFVGVESDGSRKDWIATGDVINWLREVRSEVL